MHASTQTHTHTHTHTLLSLSFKWNNSIHTYLHVWVAGNTWSSWTWKITRTFFMSNVCKIFFAVKDVQCARNV